MTALLQSLRSARLDPRAVLVGTVLSLLVGVGGFVLAGVTADKADKVVTPVAQICRANTAASIELTSAGACAAADDARTAGPYVITRAGADGTDGRDGVDGAPGLDGGPGTDGKDGVAGDPGADGIDGEPGTDGADGADGEPGSSPPCLDEPNQCRGSEGPRGQPGTPGAPGAPGIQGEVGPPGPSCPAGTMLEPVTFASGENGLGCVTTASDPATTPAETP